jgi:hypothetical protein
MKRASLVLLLLAATASVGRADETAPTFEELETLCKKALTAAVASTTKTTYALDEGTPRADGGIVKPEDLEKALRNAAERSGVKLQKHEVNLETPMLRAHLTSLVVVTAKDTQVDHSLYLELEAPNRQLVHAGVTNLKKSGPGGAKSQGHHTATGLDFLADDFIAKCFAKAPPENVTLVGRAQTNSLAQQSLLERLTQRIVTAGRGAVIAPKTGAMDVMRPKNVRLLGPDVGVLVTLDPGADILYVDGNRIAGNVLLYHYKYPASPHGVPSPIVRMKKLAEQIEYVFRNDGYRVTITGPKAKVWIVDVKADPGVPADLVSKLSAAVRSTFVGRDCQHFAYEAQDGSATLASARDHGADVIVTPFVHIKGNTHEVAIEVRTTAEEKLLDSKKNDWTEEEPKK